MKGAKRDAEREITMPVYSATYNGKGINHRTNARSMARQRNNAAQYDRELRRKIDRRTAQRALEMANRRIKIERQKKAGAKRAKEAFDRLAREDTSAQAEDKRREIAALRRKQMNSDKRQSLSGKCRFVVGMGETMSGGALNAGFQFARSKVPNEKAWRNTYDQVQSDWGTRKSLCMKWARVLTRRMRHRQLEAEKRGSQKSTKRVFMCSKRATALDGVQGKGLASLWQPVVVNDMLGYVSTVPGIGVGTGLFVIWTKRMPGSGRFDPPGRCCQWQEPIECRGHPLGFDWKARRDAQRKIRNATDTPENAKLERPPRFQKLHHATVNCQAVSAAEASSIGLEPVIEARGFGMLRQQGEYLWSPSKKQRAEERAGRGWKLQQIQPEQVQDRMASTTEQVVEISQGVYVSYPTHWLRTVTSPDYVTVTLLNGSQVRYCRDAMERAVMDTASGGCHVRMTTNGAEQGVRLGGQGSTTVADLSSDSDDGMPSLVASDSECDDDEDESESSDDHSDSSSNTKTMDVAQPLIAWRLLSDAFARWMRYDGCETDDSIEADDWDERSAAGSVQGLQVVFAAWREIPANMIALAGAFANWKWCVRTEGLSEDEHHSDDDDDSEEDQGSDDDGYPGNDDGSGDAHSEDGSGDAHSEDDGGSGDDQDSNHTGDSGSDDFPEPVQQDGHRQMVFVGPLDPARDLACKIIEFTLPLASPQKQPFDMTLDAIEAQLQRSKACRRYCKLKQWAFRTFRNTSHVEARLIVDTGLDLEFMRESCMQRLLMRWRLFANRLHNSKLEAWQWHREKEFDVMEECVLFWRSWAQARQQSRCRARETDVVFNCGDCTSDMMTRKLPQVHFEQARLQVLQMPEFHPLSSVMRLEPYRYFDFDAELQQYTPAFMGVQCEATAYLSTINAQVAQGTRLHLVDSGSSVFTSPHKDTIILPIKTTLRLTGVGGANSELMSPLIYTVLDANGEYVVLHYQAVYYLPSVPVALFATGPFEQQGWTFHLNAQAPCMTKGDGTCVPLFKDRATGFHWLVERTHASPTILGRRELVKQLAKRPNMGGVALEYTPVLDSSEQRTLMAEAEPKPSKMLTQYEYDTYLDRIQLGGGKALVNTRDKASKQAESDKIGHDALQNFWKMAVADFDKRKAKKSESVAEEPKERFLQRDYDHKSHGDEIKKEVESGNTEPVEPGVKVETDDALFRRERKEKQSTPQSRPIRLKIPRSRFYDNSQPKDIQKQQRFLHETLGHLSMGTIKKGLMEVRGYESVANVIDVMADDQHCNSCALGKAKMPATPTGKTVRPSRKVVNTKMFVDLSGYIEEASIYHGFHYYISAVTTEGYSYFRGLRLKSQALMGLAKIFNESGTPHTVQIDGEGALANEVAADWFASRQVHVVKTEAGQHFRNGHVECRHRIWKGMARAMIDRAGFSIDWWFLVLKHAVLITNLILLESVEPESNKAKGVERRRSVWEAHFGEQACLESYLLGPFGCLAFMILTAEQRKARGLSGHFGDRSLQGLYLGCQVDGASGVFKHLFTDGRNIFATPHAIKVVPDVYPLRVQNPRKGPIPSIDDVDMQLLDDEGGVTLAAFTAWVMEARADKEREIQLYLEYRRDCEKSEIAQAMGQDVAISLPAAKVKVRRQTKLVGDDRRTGNNRKKPYRMVAMDGDGEANHRRLEEKSSAETEPMVHPGQVDLLEELPEEMTFSRPYEGARYELAECTDFSQEQRVPSGVKDPFGRFAGRKVRRWFDSTNPKERHKMTASEGVVVKYNKQRATFRIRYQGFDRKMDVEDVDMATLEDILIMGPKYGDQRAEWGKTRDECRRAAVYAAIAQESWEEIVHNNVPLGNGAEELELGGAECYAAVEDQPVIFDDEPRNPSELARHPEREAILVSAGKEIDQLIEQEIGVEVTQAEVKQVTDKGIRILQCKMVYKRKYTIGEDGKERFLKWKSRLAVVGSSEREGWETVYSTFSPTVAFSAVRLLISLTVDPRFSVESYDLSGAFLGTELRDRAVYIRLPKDAGIHAGKILLLKKSVYGLKTSGRDFIAQLAEQILSFLVTSKCSKTGKSESFGFKRLLIDHCVFRYEDNEGNVMILLHYVDDLVIATTSLKIRDLFLTHINRKWKTTAEGKLNRYLGINYRWDEAACSCTATASAYIERIAKRFGLEETRLPDSPMDAGFEVVESDFDVPPTEEMVSLYRSLIGSIGYAATTVRFDVSYGLSVLSRFLAKPNDKLINAAKRIIKYLVKTKELGITWKITPEDRKAGFADVIFGAVDASFAMDPITRRSHAGFVTFNNHGLISWRSKLQSLVTLSSAEAEYVALADMICEVKYLRELARGLGFGQTEPTLIYEDNRAAILTAEAECSAGGRLKHVDVKYRFATEAVRNREVRVRYIPTTLNFADIMTKALVPKKHKEGVDLIISAKDAYRIVTARREMADEKYEASYFIIQDGDSDGLY
jgi:hypothetical protein